jgi:hypothetical protein
MKTVKIELPNTLLQSLLAFCAALNIRKVEVLSPETQTSDVAEVPQTKAEVLAIIASEVKAIRAGDTSNNMTKEAFFAALNR